MKKLTLNEVINNINNKENLTHISTCLIKEYKNSKEKLPLYCLIHNEIFYRSYNALTRRYEDSIGCLICKKKYLSKLWLKDINLLTKELKNKHNNIYEYINLEQSYKGKNSKINIVCKNHGLFIQKVDDHLQGHGCPKCGIHFSKGEQKLLKFLQNFDKHTSHRFKNTFLGKSEIDIYSEYYKLGIEYNGSAFHHSCDTNKFGKSNIYHEVKYNLCKQNNINLIHIFEFEDLKKWERKLKLYFENPNKFEISFKNNKRTVKYKNRVYTYYGQSFIKKRT